MGNLFWAFTLTLIAGLATSIGGLITISFKKTNKRFLSVSLGFASGVMIYISMVEILGEAKEFLEEPFGESRGTLIAIIAFLGGIILMALIDRLLPDKHNHEIKDPLTATDASNDQSKEEQSGLTRTGRFTAWAVAIHNFPEGLVTFMAALYDPILAIPIAVAIIIHNIPEGIAVAAPIYYGTGSKKKALWYSALSGLAEPLGALIGFLILRPFIGYTLYGIVFGTIAGIMIFISLDELLPAAKEHGEDPHLPVYGLVAGMAVMAFSLWLFI